MVDKALDILRRIAEKQPDLVRELPALAEAADQPRHAARAVVPGIACLPQDLGGERVLEIAAQPRRAVEVQQRLRAEEADRQKAQPLGHEQPVQPPDIRKQRAAVLARAGKEAARFDARKRGRALFDQDLLRHSVPSFFSAFLAAV